MKLFIFSIILIWPILLSAQPKKTIATKKDKVYIISATPTMNADMINGFRLAIHNGSKKKIVAFKLTFDFNDKKNTNQFDNRTPCQIQVNLKVNLPSNTSKSYVINDVNSGNQCAFTPEVVINTIVFYDGSFEKLTMDVSDLRLYK